MKYKKSKIYILIFIIILLIALFWIIPTILVGVKVEKNLKIEKIYNLKDALEIISERSVDNLYRM